MLIQILQETDFMVLNLIQKFLRFDALDWFFKNITVLGDKGVLWIFLGVLFLIIPKTRRIGLCILISLVLNYLVSNLGLKNLFQRTRPFRHSGAAVTAANLIVPIPGEVYSFPSGHAASSFAAAYAIYRNNKKYGVYALWLAGFIAFSRVYLYLHFVSDVLAGVLIGIFISGGVCNFVKRRGW